VHVHIFASFIDAVSGYYIRISVKIKNRAKLPEAQA